MAVNENSPRMTIQIIVETLQQTEEAGIRLSKTFRFPACVYLNGDMGVGKTTLTKAILQGLGYDGAVTSPTYNLIQEYAVESGVVYHMDLYRVEDPAELEFLALPDLWAEDTLFLVEWPQNGIGYLPKPDYQINLLKLTEESREKRNIELVEVN